MERPGAGTGAGEPIPPGSVRVALGRHALALVARHLRSRGVRQIAVPDYHCLTMSQPFQLEGMHLAHVATGPDLLADPADLVKVLGRDPSSWAILHCETFGAAPSPALAQTLRDAGAAGAHLVVDATHTWPDSPHVEGELVVASLRKLTGLPDGAFVTGVGSEVVPDLHRHDVDQEETRAWLAGDRDRAEDLMDMESTSVAMSAESTRLLAAIDLGRLVRHNRIRGQRLAAGLRELGLEPFSPPDAHFCLAFRHRAAGALVVELARAGVDGPVWWPRPRGWQREWPEDVVTLPLGGGHDEGTQGVGARDGGQDVGADPLAVLRALLS